jgi:RNA polymerase sigma-70 factor, ECF subfamily
MCNTNTGGSFASSIPGSTSSSLLQRVKLQDADAWRRLVRLYGPLVFLWCRQLGSSREDAADVAQEVWTAVAANVAEFRRDGPQHSFRGWLWTITRNKLRDRWRDPEPSAAGGTDARRRLEQVPDELPDSAEEVASFRGLLTRRALELIQPEFEDHTWRAFWRMAVDDRPAADVAVELDMTAGAVRQAKYRVLHRLREEMDGLLEKSRVTPPRCNR